VRHDVRERRSERACGRSSRERAPDVVGGADRAHPGDAEPVEQADRDDAAEEPDRRGELECGIRPRPEESAAGARATARGPTCRSARPTVAPCENPSKLVSRSSRTGAGASPGTKSSFVTAASGTPAERPGRRGGRTTREPRETARSSSRTRRRGLCPRVDAVEAHAHELGGRVGEREHRQRARVLAVDEDQLDPGERDDPERRRPPAEPRRVGQRRGAPRRRSRGSRSRRRTGRSRRHGLNALNTFPKSTLAATNPTQKTT